MSDSESAAYGGSWYAATRLDEPRRPRLAVDLDVDVCVIGGGLAGLTAAREIARRGWSVVLLEGRRVASGASGRNTGFVLPGFAADADKLIARVGFEAAKSLWALSQAGLDYVRGTVAEEGTAGIDPQPGWLYVSKLDNGDEFRRYAGLLGELGCEVEYWPTERLRAVLRSERYFHAVNHLAAITIHPLNYALKLAAAAERDGARIFEETPALSIDPAGVRKRIVTPSARLRANHVVLAGNVQIGPLLPRLGATLLPITTYVVTTAPVGAPLAEAIHYPGCVSDTDLADNHYRVVDGDRLMLSGRSTTWLRNPRRYVRALQADIKKTYPQLGTVAIDYAWAGTLGNTVHRMPQIGELGPGVWLASGFGGHGLNTTAMAGNLIARAIVEGDQTWRQFTPFELVWAGGFLGRAAIQLRVWIRRMRDVMAQRQAVAAERARRQAAQQAAPAEPAAVQDAVAPSPETVALANEPVARSEQTPASVAEAEPPMVEAPPVELRAGPDEEGAVPGDAAPIALAAAEPDLPARSKSPRNRSPRKSAPRPRRPRRKRPADADAEADGERG